MRLKKILKDLLTHGKKDRRLSSLDRKYCPAKFEGEVVGKLISGLDMKDYAYDDLQSRRDFCPICHNTLIPMPPKDFIFRKKTGDYWGTYDGFNIVSTKFKDFCEKRNYPNLIFTPIAKSAGFYFFETNEIYQFDYKRSDVLFINKRCCCGNYDEIIRRPRFRSENEKKHVDDFICRAEFFWGSYYKKGSVIVVGPRTLQLMKEAGLKGLYYANVYE